MKKEKFLEQIKEYSKQLYEKNLGWYPYTINRLICMLEDNKDAYELHRKYFLIGLDKLAEKDYTNPDDLMKIFELYEKVNYLKRKYF